jgi:hypothetical protein
MGMMTSNKTGADSSESAFDLKEYVEATNDAANRSRYVFIILLIATILIFVGLNNELMTSWWLDDIRKAYLPNDVYIEGLLDPKHSNKPDFKSGDIKNLPALISKLKDENNPLSKYLSNKFSANTRSILQESHSNQPDDGATSALTNDFNKLLEDPSFYNAEIFKGIQLSKETEELINQQPRRKEMVRLLNRRVLEDAYSEEIAKKDYNILFTPTFIQLGSEGKEVLTRPADVAKRDIQWNLLRTHMESRLLIRIPILGVSIHVNDLGLIGGITLVVLLLLTRASLSREIKNLNYSFKKASQANKLDEFYHALAMRQLFTIPHMKGAKRNRFLSKAPYVVCLFPAIIFWSLVVYDLYTTFTIERYKMESSYILKLDFIQWFFALIISYVAYRCLKSQYYIYYIWGSYWKWLKPTSDLCLLEPDVADGLQKQEQVVVKDNKTVLSDVIKAKLKEAKDQGHQPVLDRIRRAFREKTGWIRHFLSPQKSDNNKSRKGNTKEPLFIELDAEFAKLFSDDKEVNKVLRNILETDTIEMPKEAQNGEESQSNKDSNKKE